MPIVVQHNAPAGSYGGLGVLAGNAQYANTVYPQLVQQDQFAQQMLQRQNEIQFQVAAQQYALQQQQAFEAQRAQYVAGQQARASDQDFRQRYALGQLQGEYGLAQQGIQDQNRLYAQERLFAQQHARDEAAQQARQLLDQQHQANMLERQGSILEQKQKWEEQQVWAERFDDPFSEYDKSVQPLLEQGMVYSEADQKRLDAIRDRISKTKAAEASGEFYRSDIDPEFRAAWREMSRIKPTIKNKSPQEQIQERTVTVQDKQTGQLVTGTIDAKGNFAQLRLETQKNPTGQPPPGSDPWSLLPPDKQMDAIGKVSSVMASIENNRSKWIEQRATTEALTAKETGVPITPMAELERIAAQKFPMPFDASNVPPMMRGMFGGGGAAAPGGPASPPAGAAPSPAGVVPPGGGAPPAAPAAAPGGAPGGNPYLPQEFRGQVRQITPDMAPHAIAATPEFNEVIIPSILQRIDPSMSGETGVYYDPATLSSARKVTDILFAIPPGSWQPFQADAAMKIRDYFFALATQQAEKK